MKKFVITLLAFAAVSAFADNNGNNGNGNNGNGNNGNPSRSDASANSSSLSNASSLAAAVAISTPVAAAEGGRATATGGAGGGGGSAVAAGGAGGAGGAATSNATGGAGGLGGAGGSGGAGGQGGVGQGGNASGQGTSNVSISTSGARAAYAPDVIATPTAPCRISVGASAGWLGGSMGIAGSILDEGCDIRETSRMLHNMGFKEAAVQSLCLHESARKALEATGVKCTIASAVEPKSSPQ